MDLTSGAGVAQREHDPDGAVLARPSGLARLGVTGLSGLRAEILMVVALVAVAFAIRAPYLWTIPLWTDEGDEAIIAMRIVRLGEVALANDNAYNGPLFNYLVAGGLLIFGVNAWTPRIVALLLGTLTVIPTYLLAREMLLAGRLGRLPEASQRPAMLAGVVAALLLTANAAHIVVNSHIGWGHGVTPLFVTLATWLLVRAARLRSQGSDRAAGWWLLAAGFAWSLALQTHATVAVLLPAAAVFLLWKYPGWWRTAWLWLAGLAFIVGQTPTILNSIKSRALVFLNSGVEQRNLYEGTESDSLGGYVSNLLGLVHSLGATLAGQLNDPASTIVLMWHPLLVLAFALTAVALLVLATTGRPLPLLLLGAMLLGLPYLHGAYEPIVSRSRYIMPVAPIILAAWAVLAVEAWNAWSRHAADALLRQRIGGPALAGGLTLLALGSLVSLVGFYDGALRSGRTNTRLIANYERLLAARQGNEPIGVDRAMLRDWTLTEGRLQRVFTQWLEMDGIPVVGFELLPDGRFSGGRQEAGGLAVLARGSLARASRAYELDEIVSDAAPDSPADRGYAIVRATRRR